MTDTTSIVSIDLLARWNRWGTHPLKSGFQRDVVARILPFLHTPEAVTFIGPRRAGKTTAMFQVIDAVVASGVPVQGTLHLNLEEPGFSPDLGPALMDRIWNAWRREVYPEGRAWVFLDEVQRLPDWERWVRTRMERDGAKVFVTGSSSALLSRELGTLLTGRHVSFRVFPLSFSEFLRFREIPSGVLASTPLLESALLDYLRWGGFPEVVLSRDSERKSALLKQYVDDILFKDVALRHGVRDLPTLRNLAIHLLKQTASLQSHQRLANTFGVSLDLARAYVAFLQEAFLIETMPFMSLKATERQRNPWKVHAVDTGLRTAMALWGSEDWGRGAETMVHAQVRRSSPDGVFWWKGKGEVDMLVQRGIDVTEAIQVTWSESGTVPDRELAALEEVRRSFPTARRRLVTGPGAAPEVDGVDSVSLARFLLEA